MAKVAGLGFVLIAIFLVVGGAFGAATTTPAVALPNIDIQLPDLGDVRVSEHAVARHQTDTFTPDEIRNRANNDLFVELWFSPEQEKFLYLTNMGIRGNKHYWGGRIVGSETYTEITSFARPRVDWNKIILRDHYMPWNDAAIDAAIEYQLVWW